jgi:hypothetical protein
MEPAYACDPQQSPAGAKKAPPPGEIEGIRPHPPGEEGGRVERREAPARGLDSKQYHSVHRAKTGGDIGQLGRMRDCACPLHKGSVERQSGHTSHTSHMCCSDYARQGGWAQLRIMQATIQGGGGGWRDKINRTLEGGEVQTHRPSSTGERSQEKARARALTPDDDE